MGLDAARQSASKSRADCASCVSSGDGSGPSVLPPKRETPDGCDLARCFRRAPIGPSCTRSKPRRSRRWPYHTFVPSFGEWGFVLVARGALVAPILVPPRGPALPDASRLLAEIFAFPRDMARIETPIDRLDNQALVSRYVREWGRWDAW